jgi:hypothetical protein
VTIIGEPTHRLKHEGIFDDDKKIEVDNKLGDLQGKGARVCTGSFDKIRVIIRNNECAMATFATSGHKGSHIGFYSEHPVVISFFKAYFRTKLANCK